MTDRGTTRPSRPSRPTTVRVAGLLVAVVVALSLLWQQAATGTGLGAADGPVLRWFVGHRTAGLDVAAQLLTQLGGDGVVLLGGLGLLALARLRGGPVGLQVAGVAVPLLAWLTTSTLKVVLGRERPPAVDQIGVVLTDRSFPSGHTALSAALFGTAVLVVLRVVRRGPRRHALVAASVTAAVVVATTRLYLAHHWFTDVLGGWTLSLGLVLAAAVLLPSGPGTGRPAQADQAAPRSERRRSTP